MENTIPKDILRRIQLSRIASSMTGDRMASLIETLAYIILNYF
ncbi:hypothetical protein SAMN04489796_10928 [Winogradskyella thalassocola]|uniref:Uncharacterized protein n=1 Tax=Winogradskyella thalassocola TaxID=262004 RepID=A0A1G8JB25_9FLAO|nr:hypothetical protein SAMN04489796_10928 [Winogradskyella thalassocola]